MLSNAGMDDAAAESNSRLLFGGPKTKAGTFVTNMLSGTLSSNKRTSALNRTGKLFNVVSALVSTELTVADIANGEPVKKSIRTNLGGLAAGTAASTGYSAAVTQGGLLSVGGATVSVGSLGVGFAATTAFTYFQDHDMRDLYRDLSDDGGNSPTDNSDEYRKARFGH